MEILLEIIRKERSEKVINSCEITEYEDRIENRLNGDLHRDEGPAVEFKDGHKEWRKNGELKVQSLTDQEKEDYRISMDRMEKIIKSDNSGYICFFMGLLAPLLITATIYWLFGG